jgi:hypothetical protein
VWRSLNNNLKKELVEIEVNIRCLQRIGEVPHNMSPLIHRRRSVPLKPNITFGQWRVCVLNTKLGFGRI